MTISARRPPSKLPGALCILAGLWPLVWVWWAQHVMGMVPCALCYWERWPYRVLIVLGLIWIVLAAARRGGGALIAALVTATLLAAIGIAFLHVGVEQGWWPSPLAECAGPHFSGGSIAERLASMPLRPAKPCDAPNRLLAWLPVSMTTLDLIYAVLLLAGGWLLLRSIVQPRRRTR